MVAWCGDGNNMAASWIHAAVRFGFELRLACPEPLRPPQEVLDWAASEGGRIVVTGKVASGTVISGVHATETIMDDIPNLEALEKRVEGASPAAWEMKLTTIENKYI